MDIQQSDKESLAAYVHHFKWEANRCKFNNDTATIRIFLKGLKNVHTLATKVYEKGPQSLADTVKKVEKLQGAQQIASTLYLLHQSIPCPVTMTSVSNVRKLAKWHATVPISNVLTVTTMDMLPQTALIKYCLQAH